jgi:dTDP-4-amino-4,6-dideoxygalactose transaminase
MLGNHGQRQKYVHELEGSNCRLDAIQAGFINVKLEHILDWNAERRTIADHYDNAFRGIAGLEPVKIQEYNIPSRHLYVIHVSNRDKLIEHLTKNGVGSGLHYPLPVHLQPCYKHLGFKKGDFPNTEQLAEQLISLPIYPGMLIEQANYVIKEVKNFVDGQGK